MNLFLSNVSISNPLKLLQTKSGLVFSRELFFRDFNPLTGGGDKRSYVLKQTCCFYLQICLSTCDLLLPSGIKVLRLCAGDFSLSYPCNGVLIRQNSRKISVILSDENILEKITNKRFCLCLYAKSSIIKGHWDTFQSEPKKFKRIHSEKKSSYFRKRNFLPLIFKKFSYSLKRKLFLYFQK